MELVKYRGRYAVYWRSPEGQPQRRSLGTFDAAEAQRRLVEYKRTLDLRRRDLGFTIAELWEARRNAMAGRRLAENMVWSGRHLLPVFGHLRASQVTPDLVSTYTKTRGGSVGTVWTELNHLRMTLSWAKKTQMIQDHPTVPLPPRPPP